MPYAKNTISVFGAKIKEIQRRQNQQGKMIVTVKAYEYQGKNKQTDEPEGLFWEVELWEKTAEFFLNKNPQENDYIAFSGSVIDSSFQGNDGKKIYRQKVRVDNIEILKARDSQPQYQQPAQTQYQPPADTPF